MRVAVVGVGNIGLNLLLSLRRRGLDAIGIDVDTQRLRQLQAQGVTGLFARAEAAPPPAVWIITTSTGPNLSHLFGAADAIAPDPGALISVESTLPVGTMERLRARFEERGYKVGENLYLAHVPHRILFGEEESVLEGARVVGGVTKACRERALAFYAPLVADLHPVADVRIAEMAKIVENAARFVDIAFAEELFRYCHRNGLDFQELRRAVNTKGNVHLMVVDYGIGGECLPKDIRFLQESLESAFLAEALRADYRHQRLLRKVAGPHHRILIRGITFKPGYADLRFSPALALAKALQAEGKAVFVHDPLLSPEAVAALGLNWGRPEDPYDLVYERPLALMSGRQAETETKSTGAGKEETDRGQDPGDR
ncbi:MAG: UDP binding domain-containing protein [Bacillota bacterium]